MKSISILFAIVCFAVACKKKVTMNNPVPPTQPYPVMKLIDLADSNIAFGKIASYDLNNDGEKDIFFSTQLVGDPVEQKDKRQWMVTSSFNTNLAVNTGEQTPSMNYAEVTPLTSFGGYYWYYASQVLLSQKTITMTMPPYWEGKWEDASHHFLPVQITKQTGLYNGWVEISFNTITERLILHRAAVSTEVNRQVVAGK